jgi:hypothetical protein
LDVSDPVVTAWRTFGFLGRTYKVQQLPAKKEWLLSSVPDPISPSAPPRKRRRRRGVDKSVARIGAPPMRVKPRRGTSIEGIVLYHLGKTSSRFRQTLHAIERTMANMNVALNAAMTLWKAGVSAAYHRLGGSVRRWACMCAEAGGALVREVVTNVPDSTLDMNRGERLGRTIVGQNIDFPLVLNTFVPINPSIEFAEESERLLI